MPIPFLSKTTHPQGAASGLVWVADASGTGSWQKVNAAGIADGAIANNHLAASGLDASKLTVGTLSSERIGSVPAAKVYQSANTSIPSGGAIVSMNTELFDTANMWVSSAPSRITIQRTGVYLLAANSINSAGTTVTGLGTRIRKNGSLYLAWGYTNPSVHWEVGAAGVARLVAGDYIELFAWANGALTIWGGEGKTDLSVVWLGP